MELKYYYKKEFDKYIFEIFNIRFLLPVPYKINNRFYSYIDSLLVLIHGNNRVGIGEAVFTDEKELEEATVFSKEFMDNLSLDYLYGIKIFHEENGRKYVAINTALESFREELILGRKFNKISFDVSYYINSDDCLLKIYQYKPKVIKLNIGSNYLKDIEIIKKIQQIITVFKLDCKFRIYGNGLYHTFETGQLLTQLDPNYCECLIQLLPDYLETTHLSLKEQFKKFNFGLNSCDVKKLNSEKWACKLELSSCGSLDSVFKTIRDIKSKIYLGSEISGYINNIYELYVFSKNFRTVDHTIESKGFAYLAEDFSGIRTEGPCSYTIDLNVLMSSFLKGLNIFRKK